MIRFLLSLTTLGASLLAAAPVEGDLCVYGGTSAGVIAAVQAAKMGKKVVLVEAGRHLGGMCSEGLGGTDIDNHPGFQNSPAVGGMALEFYRRVSARYGREKVFDAMLRTRGKNTSLWRFEPHVAEAVFDEWVREAGVTVLRGHRLKETNGVSKDGARITALHFENGAEVRARIFIDATYEGDLLAFAGVRFAVGREGNAKYGETKNGIRTDTTHGQFDKSVDPYRVPGDPSSGLIYGVQDSPLGKHGGADESIQGYRFRLCLTKDPSNRLPIGKPESYDPGHYELQRRYLAAGGVISPPASSLPNGKTDPGTWHFLAGNFTGWNHLYPVATYTERDEMLRASRDHIQGVHWFMANDPAVPEAQRAIWEAWGLCKDEFTDNGGWPRAFYVRNGRRMTGDFILTEAHIRKAAPEAVVDSVGLIWWPPDLHHARRLVKDGRVWNEGAVFTESGGVDWIPCGITYRCLVPGAAECVNLLTPTCPSSSYVAYGAYRIEFTFMVAAQSAATAAVMAIEQGSSVQDLPFPALRERLLKDGQVLEIPAADQKSDGLHGILQMTDGHAAAGRKIGLRVAVVPVSWDRFEPARDRIDAAYVLELVRKKRALRALGYRLMLDPGVQYPPAWVFSLPHARYKNQFGDSYESGMPGENIPNVVFNAQVRVCVAKHFEELFKQLGSDWDYVRLGCAKFGELNFPHPEFAGRKNCYWAFDDIAQGKSPGLPDGMTPCPVPAWIPGTASPRSESARLFSGWYLESLRNYQDWQIAAARRHYAGDICMLYGSWGIRPENFRPPFKAIYPVPRPRNAMARSNRDTTGPA